MFFICPQDDEEQSEMGLFWALQVVVHKRRIEIVEIRNQILVVDMLRVILQDYGSRLRTSVLSNSCK